MAKKPVTIWVEEDLLDRLDYLSAAEGLKRSQFGSILLERAIREHADQLGWDVVGRRIELAVSKEFARMTDRLEYLLFRTSIDSATARGLVFQILKIMLDDKEAAILNKAVNDYALKRMKQPLEGLEEIKQAAREGMEAHGRRQSELREEGE